jgi:hypothetical protein
MTTAARYPFALVFAAACALYVFTASGYIIVSDTASMLAVSQSLLHGHLNVPCDVSHAVGPGGLCYSFYGLGWSLAALPVYLLGDIVGAHVHLGGPYQPTLFAVSFLNPVLVAGIVALLAKFIHRLSGSLRIALLVAAVFAVGSPAWVYTKDGFSEPLAGLCLLIAAYVLTVETRPGMRHGLLVGSLLGLAVLTRIDVLPSALLIIAYGLGQWGWKPRRVHAALSLALGSFGLLEFAYNDARFGSVFNTGYEYVASGASFHRSLSGTTQALVQLLLNPAEGLFWFVPTLLITLLVFPAFYAHARRLALLCAGVCLAEWLVHANLFSVWQDGFSWGPRYFFPVIPFMFLPLAALRWAPRTSLVRAGLGAGALLGIVGNSIAVFVRFERYDYASGLGLNPGPWPQLYLWRSAVQVVGNVVTGNIPLGRLSELRGQQALVANATVLNEPDFWWFHLLHAHTLTHYVLPVLAGCVVLLIVSWRLLARVWRRGDAVAERAIANPAVVAKPVPVASLR